MTSQWILKNEHQNKRKATKTLARGGNLPSPLLKHFLLLRILPAAWVCSFSLNLAHLAPPPHPPAPSLLTVREASHLLFPEVFNVYEVCVCAHMDKHVTAQIGRSHQKFGVGSLSTFVCRHCIQVTAFLCWLSCLSRPLNRLLFLVA